MVKKTLPRKGDVDLEYYELPSQIVKSIIFAIFALFFLQFPAKAEMSKDEVQAAQQKLFVLCALNDGLDKERLEKEMKIVLKNTGIDPNLVNNKDVIES